MKCVPVPHICFASQRYTHTHAYGCFGCRSDTRIYKIKIHNNKILRDTTKKSPKNSVCITLKTVKMLHTGIHMRIKATHEWCVYYNTHRHTE